MALSVRDWIVIVGVLLFLALLLDGFRRVRAERRDAIRVSLKARARAERSSDERPDVLMQNPELPNGGARVVSKQGGLRLDADVPVLMDAEADPHDEATSEWGAPDAVDSLLDAYREAPKPTPSTPAQASAPSHSASPPQHGTESARAESRSKSSAADALPDEVIIVNVLSRNGPFRGRDLMQILMACDLRFGKMNIFHRYEQASGRGPIQFSVANAVEPGVFNLDDVDTFSTPGVCFFMTMPGPEEPLKAFEHMVETAQCLVKHLDGELRDDARSVMTMQTLEHCRQRIMDFERRQLAHQA